MKKSVAWVVLVGVVVLAANAIPEYADRRARYERRVCRARDLSVGDDDRVYWISHSSSGVIADHSDYCKRPSNSNCRYFRNGEELRQN